MSKTILSTTRTDAGSSGVTTAGSTQFWWFGYASALPDSTESNREITYRAAGTVSKLYVRVISNGTSSNSTLTLRKNGSDTALTVTITAGTNAVFEDTSNSVSVAAGDKLCWKSISGGTGTLTFAIISAIYDSTTNCTARYVTEGYGVATASATQFLPVCGNRSGTTTSEANVENTIKTAGSVKNAFVYVSANARTTNTTITLRKNRADTSIIFTYGNLETGIKEDTSNTVSFAADDELDWEITTSTGTQTLTLQCAVCDYETTTDNGVLTRGAVGSTADYSFVTGAGGLTWYYPLGAGTIESITTEADAQMKARETFDMTNLIAYTNSNSIAGNTILCLRTNASDSSLTLTIGSSATGFFADTTHTVTLTAATDLINFKITTAITSGTLSLRQTGITTKLTGGPQNITRTMTTETVAASSSVIRLNTKKRRLG